MASGRGYISQSDMRVHFGLGTSTRIDKIEIHWANSATEIVPIPAVDRMFTLVQGKGIQPLTAASRICALTIAFTLCAGSAEEDRSQAALVRRWTEGITDVSGLAALTPFSRYPTTIRISKSICSMKQTVVANALQATTDYLAHLKSAPEPQRNNPEIMKLHHQLVSLRCTRAISEKQSRTSRGRTNCSENAAYLLHTVAGGETRNCASAPR